MSEPITTETNQTPVQEPETTEATLEKKFDQSDIDHAVGKAIARIKKNIPPEEELTAFREWKESQQTEKERWDALTKDRDTAHAELTAAQAKIEQYEHEKFLLTKGVPADDVDYYVFKIGKLVNDTTDFETAATEYLKGHLTKPEKAPGTIQVDLGGPLSGNTPQSLSDIINNRLRGR